MPLRQVRVLVRLRQLDAEPWSGGPCPGTITLHGQRVAVLDLHQALGIGHAVAPERPVLIVVKRAQPEEQRRTALLVDAVLEVRVVQQSEIEPAARACSFLGIGHLDDRSIPLVDLEQALAAHPSFVASLH